LRQYCLEAENDVKEREELAYLPKPRRDDIRETVRLKLLKRAIPQSNIYDVIWNLQTGDLLFGATGSKLCDEFVEFFQKTFERLPVPVHPYAQARHLFEMAGKAPGAVDGVKPVFFAEEVPA
jgi:DNA recombination-dependent growth factor C